MVVAFFVGFELESFRGFEGGLIKRGSALAGNLFSLPEEINEFCRGQLW